MAELVGHGMTPILTLAPGLLEVKRSADRPSGTDPPNGNQKARAAATEGEQLALREMQTSYRRFWPKTSSDVPEPMGTDRRLRDLRRDPAVRGGRHHRHLAAPRTSSGDGRNLSKLLGAVPEEGYVDQCKLPGLRSAQKAEQVACKSKLGDQCCGTAT